MLGKARLQPAHVPNQATTEIVWLEQPLVRIEHERVGTLHALEQLTTAFGQNRGRAVGTVHVQPEIVLVTYIGNFSERIHRTRIGRTGGCDDTKRTSGSASILFDRPRQRGDIELEMPVDRNQPNLIRPKAENANILPIRGMRLIRAVNDRIGHDAIELHLPRGHQSGQVGNGSATDEDPTPCLGKSTQL